ncbi:3' terminal RNA ribose 2'-O-methyltransferase Hen1 [Streptomyces sp. NPDC050560]|uniref:3' terminal RNA ribose 2'-O-methyltransferase Hen1 n=1 Tax=Streptomyces sp. NPDC050560 TaxID=3365630 RepID=UPI00378981F8
MFLTIGTTGTSERPADDLGFLLHKHPAKTQRFSTSYGDAHVFYPEATPERCTAALLLDVDPVALVRRHRGRGRGGAPDSALAQYVNDRPYAASSLLAVALGKVFSSALKGRCDARPELPGRPLPLRVEIPALPARGGAALVTRFFEPLGWTVTVTQVPLDTAFPTWGDSRYVHLVLEGELLLGEALRHLYVLLPVLDGAKHYWVATDEVDKLLRAGEGWLPGHPERQLITARYFSRRWSLTRQARERLELARLAEADDSRVEDIDNAVEDTEGAEGAESDRDAADAAGAAGAEGAEGVRAAEGAVGPDAPPTGGDPARDPAPTPAPDPAPASAPEDERHVSLATRRRAAILAALRDAGAGRVLDLGCGQGQLVQELLKDVRFTEIVGIDVSVLALTVAARRLRLEQMGERRAARVALRQGSLAYTDRTLKGYDAAVLSEVVEHVDPPRLPALEFSVFGSARPRTVVVTTPNSEYNVRWETLPAGHVRHGDHRFEWTREEFRAWAAAVCERHGYTADFGPVGPEDPEVGPPTQMAVFTRAADTTAPRAGGPATAGATQDGTTSENGGTAA